MTSDVVAVSEVAVSAAAVSANAMCFFQWVFEGPVMRESHEREA